MNSGRVMLVGEGGAGKRSLMRALGAPQAALRQPLAVSFCGPFILTPSEFLENRRFYRALITASADAAAIWFLHDATRALSLLPPLFAQAFHAFNRPLLGLATKIDAPGADVARAERLLHRAGLHDVHLVSAQTGEGLAALRAFFSQQKAIGKVKPIC